VPKPIKPLTDTAIKAARPRHKPYKLSDGAGLFLLVQPGGGRWWRLKYRFQGRELGMSLGTYPDTSLQLARQKRDDARRKLAEGRDPSAERQAARLAQTDTFAATASEWLEARRHAIKPVTLDKLKWLLDEVLGPSIGRRPIGRIKAADILPALRKVEARGRNETAHRARQLAGQVFRYAVAHGRAERDPAADLRGALAPVKVTNRAAITDPARVGALLRAIDGYQGQPSTAYALKLAPLVFVRPGELRKARWGEFTLEGKEPVWRIPAERMKMGEEHLVPLSAQAVSLLQELAAITGPDGYLFPSLCSKARPISDVAMIAALRRMDFGKEEMTPHGFRAMASTLLNEQGYPPDVIELQLAHAERNEVRAAYNRAKRLPERRKMMQAWADYLDGLKAGADVVPIRRRG
jgi:integrase